MVVVVYTGQQQLRVLIRMMGTDVETLSMAVDTVHAVCCIISASSLGPSPSFQELLWIGFLRINGYLGPRRLRYGCQY